jgi:predicted Zn-dependent protease
MWRKKGFKFRMGRRGGIKFGGYNSTMSAVGRAWFSYKGGKIYKCTILLNPRYFHRYPIELTMAHEIGHCLGMTGHIEGGLMSRYAGKTRIKPDTVKFFNYIYARKPGAKL